MLGKTILSAFLGLLIGTLGGALIGVFIGAITGALIGAGIGIFLGILMRSGALAFAGIFIGGHLGWRIGLVVGAVIGFALFAYNGAVDILYKAQAAEMEYSEWSSVEAECADVSLAKIGAVINRVPFISSSENLQAQTLHKQRENSFCFLSDSSLLATLFHNPHQPRFYERFP